MRDKIEKVLDEKVRPELWAHGGDIEVISFEDGVLRFKFLGACSGCPSAYLTTENLVMSAVMGEIPEVKETMLVQQVSDDLLAEARKILGKRSQHES